MDAERSSRRWKWVAIAALLSAAGLLAALVAVVARPARTPRMTDERLIGTWKSDADRTIAGIAERRTVDDKGETDLRKLFGKMRVTYTPTVCTTDLEGTIESSGYEVLGRDKYSVVIREVKDHPSSLDGYFELSEFTVIQFDGPDSYWLTTKIGDIREHFTRVR